MFIIAKLAWFLLGNYNIKLSDNIAQSLSLIMLTY
nr:MAG TPA_asm: hypothetical protein [Caudoviricetes sp.]